MKNCLILTPELTECDKSNIDRSIKIKIDNDSYFENNIKQDAEVIRQINAKDGSLLFVCLKYGNGIIRKIHFSYAKD